MSLYGYGIDIVRAVSRFQALHDLIRQNMVLHPSVSVVSEISGMYSSDVNVSNPRFANTLFSGIEVGFIVCVLHVSRVPKPSAHTEYFHVFSFRIVLYGYSPVQNSAGSYR